jgi:murein DD-endopeptidase MepM/ murein hydrolase activator NlpD
VFASDAPTVSAFWPFYSTAQADTLGIIPNSDTPALEAPTNSDPTPPGPSLLATTEGVALVSNQGPDGVPSADSIVDPANTQISTYLVKPGDTLSQIAQTYGVSVNTIIWANDLGNSPIQPGQTLVILPISGVEHTVVAGDTLASVAQKYGGDPADIAGYNGLDPAAPLVVGSQIIIPNGEANGSSLSSGSVSGKSAKKKEGSVVAQSNPYRGGSGPEIDNYYENPVSGDIVTQGLHGLNAVDLGAPRGTPIHAAADGIVIVARDNGGYNGGYGNYVVISHPNDTQTLYAHMITGSITVTVGESVSQGDVIGRVGMTGDATGPHVHLEIRGAFNIFASCPVGTRPGEFTCDN